MLSFNREAKRLTRLTLLVAMGWSALIGYSLYTTLRSEEEGALAMATNTARANFFKDQAFRLWASQKGGLYAVVDEHTQPVPYMAHVPGRDIKSVDGRQLTLMNPASMLREMMDEYADLYGIKGRIVGIVTLNPNNRADAWEEKAIHAFQRGKKEVFEITEFEGKPHLRLIRPMVMQPVCMKCHGHLGFKLGEVRGAVGVSVPLAEYYASAQALKDRTLLTHGMIWLIGLVGGGFAYGGQRRRLAERENNLKDMSLAARVFEGGLQAIAITDPNGIILRVNKAFTDITGYTAAEAIGHKTSLLKSGLQDTKFYEAMWRGILEEGRWSGELWNRHKDGRLYAVSEHNTVLLDDDGQVRHFICMFEDITKRKQAESALNESEAHYREAQRTAHLGHWSYDTTSESFIWWSEETFRLLGLDPAKGDPTYAEFIERVHPDDRESVNAVVGRCLEDSQPFIVSYRVPLADGGIRRLEAKGEAHRNDHGQVTRMSGTVMDVTEQRQAEERLQTFRALADASVDAIVIANPQDTCLTYANRAAHEMFGCDFERKKMVGKPGKIFWPPEDFETMARVIDQAVAGNWQGDVRQLRANGEVFDANATVFAIGGANGQPVHIVAIIRDITAQKQAEAALQIAHAKLETIIDFLPDATFVIDSDGRVIAWNRAIEKMAGIAKSQIIGQGNHLYADAFYGNRRPMLIDLVLGNRVDGPELYSTYEQHGDTLIAEGFTPEVYGGKGAYVWATALPLKDANGKVIGAIECVRDITEAKHAELALKKNEERLRLALEGTSDAIWDWDVQTGKTYFSPRYYTMLGYEPGDFPANYESWRGLLHPDDRASAEAAVQTHISHGEGSFAIEFRCRCKDGSWRWILGRGKVVERDASGNPVRLAGSQSDITERRMAEEALKLTQYAIDHASIAFEWLNLEGKVVACNIQACQSLGYTQDEFIGMHVWDFTPEATKDIWQRHVDAVRREGHQFLEAEHRRKDGSAFPIEIRANFVKFGEQEFIFAYLNDITDRKRAEEALKLTQFGVESSADAVYVIDPRNRFLDVNTAACTALGYSKDELVTMAVRDIDPDVTQDVLDHVFDDLRNKRQLRLETHHRRKNGSIFPVEVMANYIEFGGKEYNFCFVRDISERKEAEQKLLELNANLEARVLEEVNKNRDKDHLLIQQSRLAAMGEMIGNIAHQWRQPINALSLVLANIKDSFEYGDLDQDYLDGQVERGGKLIQKMSTTIDDFRNFFRPDRKQQAFSLTKAVKDALMVVEVSYAHAKIDLQLEPGEDVVSEGFPNEYAQVVLNLLSNAKDAILERGVIGGRVSIRVEQGKEEARVIVSDNGGGIPEHILPKVFDPYFTTRETGTGIGLYMSRMIIENMQGHIAIANADGGARITLTTPLAANPQTPNEP